MTGEDGWLQLFFVWGMGAVVVLCIAYLLYGLGKKSNKK